MAGRPPINQPDLPELAAAARKTSAFAREASAAYDRIVGSAIPGQGLAEMQQRAVEALQVARRHLAETRVRLPSLEKLRADWVASLPANWRELDLDSGQVEATMDLIDQTGLCLIDAPRASVIQALLAAPNDSQRVRVLNDAAVEIIDDAADALRVVDGTSEGWHADVLGFANDAVAAARRRILPATQALVACRITALLHEGHAYKKLVHAREDFAQAELNNAWYETVRPTLMEICMYRALVPFDSDHPTPGFNRHATQHGAQTFFSPENALSGLLLLAAWCGTPPGSVAAIGDSS